MQHHFIKKLTNMDFTLLLSVCALMVMGTIMIYSSSTLIATEKYGDSMFFLKKHFIFLMIGLLAMSFVFFLQIRWIKWASHWLLGLCLLMLILVLVKGFGKEANNASRWLNLSFFQFQPTELTKLAVIIFVAHYLSKKGDKIKNLFGGLMPLLSFLSVIFLLILRQPDFGSVVVMGLTVLVMLFVSGARWTHLIGLLFMFGLSSYFLVFNVAYRKRRVLSFLNPWADPNGSGFQIIQSLLSFQRGGVQGQGLGDGTQKLLYLPEAHTDFIFSVVAEELGLLGSLGMIFLFLVFTICGFKLTLKLKETFVSQMALGITTWLSIQAALNMAVVMALVPTKGLTLPFVSYGGSSLLCGLLGVSILLSLSSSVNLSQKMAKRIIS